ncbi:hypothetical protein CH063_15175 [Colletotrichum higginsianum]|uniref:Uncharacterized protein n=1 Tax=Colletotrichum higginsianum (strain IMI 349063) TaxID=759273 RepID=H1W1Q3_COLHI|nr:hypothetical protein CH63R_02418 [Colletotrichum higginsianum IMI 349063]OBR13692.1 hypothetical protein CH63R_02418 [Colletotrichum higginsianum IMI 349063]CCF46416.1 hypothetical protein CH063_15175 [Colletotrichum higginsianum]
MTPNPVATFRSHTVPTSRTRCIVLVPGVCFDGRIPDTAQSQLRNDRLQIDLLRESVAIIGPSPGCKSSPPKLEIRESVRSEGRPRVFVCRGIEPVAVTLLLIRIVR